MYLLPASGAGAAQEQTRAWLRFAAMIAVGAESKWPDDNIYMYLIPASDILVSLALLASCTHTAGSDAREEQGLRGVLCDYGRKGTLPLSRSPRVRDSASSLSGRASSSGCWCLLEAGAHRLSVLRSGDSTFFSP